MSRLDEQGKWRKHWFVLGDSSLRFYRDSEAEESDDLDGEIDLTSCVNVSDCDIDKNYGLQIQTRSAVFTLSAITSRIRRNWVKLLKQAIQTNRLQSDSSSEKENPRSRRPSSSQPPARFTCRDSASSANFNQEDHRRRRRRRRSQTVEGDLSPASQREEGEGWDREQAKRLEERNKWFEAGVPLSEMGSRWDSMELKKGSVPVPTVEAADSEVSRKWAEFETLSCRDMSAQSLTGPQAFQSSTPQGSESPVGSQTFHQSVEEADQSALQTCLSNSNEAPSLVNGAQLPQTNTAEALQKEVETNKQERAAMEVEVDSPCGPRAPCRAKMEAMVVAHRKALQELQEKHAREKKELEEETHRLLQERSQAAAKDMEALKAAHREELDREVEKARRLSGGAALMDSSCRGHVPQSGILHGELNVMSERFSQKCLELNQTEQSGKSRDTELDRKQRELEQLQRENQVFRQSQQTGGSHQFGRFYLKEEFRSF